MRDKKINRKYKDRLFKKIFESKEDLLSLYNAVNGTEYSNAEDVTVNTIEDCVYMSMKNDVSFLIYGVLNLYEHQSTSNPNMPFRGFLYLAMLYKDLFGTHRDLYSSKLIELPTPQFIIFYNGCSDEPDECYMKMSDAYVGEISGEPALECRARMLNINYDHNKELMDKCKRLKDYALLVKKVRDNLAMGMSKEVAILKAIDSCIKEDVLSDILLRHKAEVTDMLLTEYDEELHINNEKDISYREGRIDGLAEGEEERKRLLEENERLLKEIEELKMKDAKYK